jgi:ribonucleoside-diphosphate reductase beta chain
LTGKFFSQNKNKMEKNIFNKRTAFKPFEYPELYDFVDAINHSYWIHTEYSYDSDIQDFKVNLTSEEKNAVKNAMLAISQIEINVKRFWSNLYVQFPKPEFDALGSTFGESEVRHSRAYSHVLELLGLNDAFDKLIENPVIQGRIDYLSKYLKNAGSNNKELYTLTLLLFSLFIENCSLFSQFFIIKSFNKYKNTFKGIDNVIQATAKEENLHAMAGAHIITLIKKENTEWFNDEFYKTIERACKKAYLAEEKIIDWIFEEGELSFLPKQSVLEFTKNRFNKSLEMIGITTIFEVDKEIISNFKWFDIEISSETHTDFFHKTPTSYSKKTQSITLDDIF